MAVKTKAVYEATIQLVGSDTALKLRLARYKFGN